MEEYVKLSLENYEQLNENVSQAKEIINKERTVFISYGYSPRYTAIHPDEITKELSKELLQKKYYY